MLLAHEPLSPLLSFFEISFLLFKEVDISTEKSHFEKSTVQYQSKRLIKHL